MTGQDYHKEAQRMMRTSVWSFRISLGLGTLLFLFFIAFDTIEILILGFFYVLTALFFNSIILLNNIIFICSHKEGRNALIWRTLLLLLNIPVTLLYISGIAER